MPNSLPMHNELKYLCRPLYGFVLLLLFQVCNCQEKEFADIYEYVENITVSDPDSGFLTEISAVGKTGPENISFPIFYDAELQKIENIRVYEKRGNNYKSIHNPVIKDVQLDVNFHSSRWLKIIQLEPEADYKITYSVRCHELMMLSHFSFFSFQKIDTAIYHIQLPASHFLYHNIIYRDSLFFYSLDSVSDAEHHIYTIKTTSLKTRNDPLIALGIYQNIRLPLMRLLVVPNEYKNRETAYFNNWYLQHIKNLIIPDSLVRSKTDSLTSGLTDELSVVRKLYHYMKTNFKYVDMEVGMGAFIPHDINTTFRNRQGDCKDLTLLLCEMLKYKGIDARNAMASSFDYICDTDFPSLSSANHVICVAQAGGKRLLLDPTDYLHRIGDPVQSLQNKTIFITGSDGGEYYRVKPLPPEKNLNEYTFNLKLSDNTLTGNIHASWNGFSGNTIRNLYKQNPKSEFDKLITKHLENMLGNQHLSNIQTTVDDDMVEITGELTVRGKYYSDNTNKGFLFFDFIPGLFDFDYKTYKIKEETFTGSTIYKKISVIINFDKNINHLTFNNVQINDNLLSLNLSVQKIADSMIQIELQFKYNHVWVDFQTMDQVNRCIETYLKKSNEPVIIN